MRSKSQHEEPTVAAHAALLLCELKQDARAGRAIARLAENGKRTLCCRAEKKWALLPLAAHSAARANCRTK